MSQANYSGVNQSLHQQMVEHFMLQAGQQVPSVPTIPDVDTRTLRAKLMFEELMETLDGLGVRLQVSAKDGDVGLSLNDPDGKLGALPNFYFTVYNKQQEEYLVDMVQVVDGCCDLRVTTTGTLSAVGVKDIPVQLAVDKSNLEKFGPGGYRRDDGKWMKPPGWKAPDIAAILQQLGTVPAKI